MTIKSLIALFVAVFFISPVFALAPKSQILPIATFNQIQLDIARYAFVYDVPEDTLNRVLRCESNFNPLAINSTEREYSVGISQINLKAHKGISMEEALNPDFSIRYLASEIAKGHGNAWSCY